MSGHRKICLQLFLNSSLRHKEIPHFRRAPASCAIYPLAVQEFSVNLSINEQLFSDIFPGIGACKLTNYLYCLCCLELKRSLISSKLRWSSFLRLHFSVLSFLCNLIFIKSLFYLSIWHSPDYKFHDFDFLCNFIFY